METDTGLDDIEENYGNEYYWLLAVDSRSSRPIILGPYDTEESARRTGFEKIQGAFDVVPLPTRNPARATKILKYRRFDQTANIDEALKRANHQGNMEE